MTNDNIHTCHEQCQRTACILRRERDAANARIEKLRTALEDECMCKRIHSSIEQCSACDALADDAAKNAKK